MIETLGIFAALGIMGYGVTLLKKLVTNHASHIQGSLADLKAISTSSTVRIVNASQATTTELIGLRSDLKQVLAPRLKPARARARRKK